MFRFECSSIIVAVIVVFLGIFVGLYQIPGTFDPQELQHIIDNIQQQQQQRSIPWTLNETIIEIQRQVVDRYGSDVIDMNDEWLFNLAGGFKTGILLLHASLTEYVAIWGTQISTTGHSGRNWAEFHDWIFTGNGSWWHEGGLDVTVHRPYSYVYTAPFAGRIIHLDAGTWMLEYCHGVIPALLPFGLGDSLLSSLDPILVYKSLRVYGRLTFNNLLRGKL